LKSKERFCQAGIGDKKKRDRQNNSQFNKWGNQGGGRGGAPSWGGGGIRKGRKKSKITTQKKKSFQRLGESNDKKPNKEWENGGKKKSRGEKGRGEHTRKTPPERLRGQCQSRKDSRSGKGGGLQSFGLTNEELWETSGGGSEGRPYRGGEAS